MAGRIDADSRHLRRTRSAGNAAWTRLARLFGPRIALVYLRGHSHSFRALFVWAFVPGLLAALLVCAVKESPPNPFTEKITRPESSAAPSHLTEPLNPSPQRLPPKFLGRLGIDSRLANSSDMFLILKAKAIGLGLASIIALYTGYNLVATRSAASGWARSPTDGAWKSVIIGGLLVFALVYAG